MIAAALLVFPWALAWALARRHHLDSTVVTILVAVTIPLAGLWLTWATFRNACRPAPANGDARPGIITAAPGSVVADRGGIAIGPGSVVADRGGTAIGQVVYQQRRGITGKPVRLAPRPVFLAGREGLLAELDARLARRPKQSGPQLVALYGLGGAGKTSVAVEYAHRHLAEVGVCWQFQAEDATVLAAEFGVLAAQLGAREVVDPRDPVVSVHAVLARAQFAWLVVFDNVPDRAAVERFVPPAGPGRVLITTQNQLWPPGLALDVPVLGRDVATDFLVSRTGDPDRAAAGELADDLGGLPLALEQAAAYMQATGTTLALYLPLFRDRQTDLLARGEVSGHPADVAATLGLALSLRSVPPARRSGSSPGGIRGVFAGTSMRRSGLT